MVWLNPSYWLWIPLLASIVVVAKLPTARSQQGVVIIGAISLMCLALSVAGTAFWGWLLRDGLGPDAVESQGLLAIQHFLADGTGLALLLHLCVGIVVVWTCRRRFLSLRP